MNLFKGASYLSLAASIWGMTYIVSKVVLDYISPWLLLELRYLFALLALSVICIYQKGWKINKKDILPISMIGLVGYTASIGLQFIGTKYSGAVMGSLITSASPALISFFAFLILKEKISRIKIISLLLATMGVIVVIGVPNGNTNDRAYYGNLILVGAAVTWSLYTVLSKVQTIKYPSLTVTTWATAFGVIFTLPLTIIEQLNKPTTLPANFWIWMGVLFLGIISTAGAFYLWNKGFEYIDTSTGSLFFFLQPLIGTTFGYFLLKEDITATFFIGSFLILLAVYLSMKDPKKETLNQTNSKNA